MSLRVLPSVRTSFVRFWRFASTFFDGRSIFDSTASVIVVTTLPARLSIRTITTSARIAATITRIAVALINASRKSTGNLRSRAEISFRWGLDKNASCRAGLLTLNRKSVDQLVLLVVVLPSVDGLRDATIFGRRFGPCCTRCGPDLLQGVRLRLELSSKDRRRCHIGRGCWRAGENLYSVGMPSLWQTDALAGRNHRRTALQRCIRNAQQCNQRKTYHSKKGESWHCRPPTRLAPGETRSHLARPHLA